MPLSEAQFLSLREDSVDNVESYLLDADGLDAVFFLYSIVLYVAVRLILNLVAPGLHKNAATANARKYSRQQYLMVFFQKGLLLPLGGIGWMRGILPPELIYLLTGAYVLSDSMVNAQPVRGGSWGGNLGVHAHHVFTVVLCTVGAHLPTALLEEGARVVLVGEAGSLWLTVTILHPTPLNIKLRFYAFVASRLFAIAVGLKIAQQSESRYLQAVLIGLIVFLGYDNLRTLRAMSGIGGVTAGSFGRSDSLATDLKDLSMKQH